MNPVRLVNNIRILSNYRYDYDKPIIKQQTNLNWSLTG